MFKKSGSGFSYHWFVSCPESHAWHWPIIDILLAGIVSWAGNPDGRKRSQRKEFTPIWAPLQEGFGFLHSRTLSTKCQQGSSLFSCDEI
jgi:hypothetical protein